MIVGNLQALVAARDAQLAILTDSEALRAGLEEVQGSLSAAGGMGWFNVILIGLSLLLCGLGGLGLLAVFTHDQRQRASLSDAQRAEAERQEREAKRVNDANQAAILRLMNELQTVAEGDLTQQATVTGVVGMVHVGALPAMTPGLLPVAMAAFKAQMPKASVTVQEGLMETLLPELRRGMLDVVVGRLLSPNKPDDLDEEPLYDGTNVLVVKAGHPLGHTDAPTWADLVRHPWVLPPVGSLSREPLENVLQQHGCALPVDGIETLSIPLIAQYLQLRNAVGIMSWVVAQHYIEFVVLIALVGVVPYVALQLKAISHGVGLLAGVAVSPARAQERTVDVHISHLRKKLGGEGRGTRLIQTVRGSGYRFSQD